MGRTPNPRAEACAAYLPLNGRAPYGCRFRDDAASLEPDPYSAPVVQRIFHEYVNGVGLQTIAERLTADGILSPAAYDPRRNPHHRGRAWSKPAVRAIITNSRYAVPQWVLSQRGDCTRCEFRCASRSPVALVPIELYRQAQEVMAARTGKARPDRAQYPTTCRYVLRGMVRCGLCQRLLQGNWNNNAAYYRCRFPRQYASTNSIDHPPNVYLREDRTVGALLTWICRSLPGHLYLWAQNRPLSTRTGVVRRVQALRPLVASAWHDPQRSRELYQELGVRMVYEPTGDLVRVRTEIVDGAVIDGKIEL